MAPNVPGLVPDPIDRGHVHAVGDCMRPLNGPPGIVLRCAEFFSLLGMPSNRGREEEHLCALQCRESRAFGIPLVPTNQGADFAVWSVEGLEPQVARSEIKFFIVE